MEMEDGWMSQDVQTTSFHALKLAPLERETKTQVSWRFGLLCDCLCACACEHAAMHGRIQTEISAGSMHDCC